ncbi:unnamed protein product [Ceutorhynchus assimilis]|uniref:Thioesterase domain-containing protein n=1 Tax=Ceutorhynchus assimilis TaxID=467358 RepID=A0A9N9MP97_9CUCU|nr:unnamed protein product [Ceutorhynchus assimilis]
MIKACLTPKELMQHLKTTKGFNRLIDKVKIISLENGNGLAEFTIEEEHTNSMGHLNTGCVAHVSDMLSSFAVSTHKLGNANNFHVSVNMNFELCNPKVKIGDQVQVHTKLLSWCHTLAFLEILWKNKSTGDIVVKGHHNMLRMK